jgi:hypothetical protein
MRYDGGGGGGGGCRIKVKQRLREPTRGKGLTLRPATLTYNTTRRLSEQSRAATIYELTHNSLPIHSIVVYHYVEPAYFFCSNMAETACQSTDSVVLARERFIMLAL